MYSNLTRNVEWECPVWYLEKYFIEWVFGSVNLALSRQRKTDSDGHEYSE